MRRRKLFRRRTNGTDGFRRMQTANCFPLPPRELSQNSGVRQSATNVENISLVQPFVGRDAVIGVGRKHDGAAFANHFPNQKQNSVERKVEIQSVHTAVNVNQITIAKLQITTQNFAKILFRQRWKRSNATALALPLRVTKRSKRAIGEDCLGKFLQIHASD